MADLTHDVWTLIARLLEVHHLLQLAAVNRSFYNIVLDTRYAEIHWVKLDNYMLKTLVRLQDPLIARRVRRLRIRAWFIQYLVSNSATSKPPSSQERAKKWTSDQLSTISKHLSTVKTTLNLSPDRPKHPSHWWTPTRVRVFGLEHRLRHTLSASNAIATTPSSLIPLMLNAFQHMIHLTEYDFEWRDLALTKTTRSFLPDNSVTLSSLCKLVLHAQLPQFRYLLPQFMLNLPGIQDLELYLDYNPPSILCLPTPSEITQTLTLNHTILTTTIAPFITSLRSSLSSLKIASSANWPESFSHLHALVIRIPFDNEHLSDTEGLVRLLQTHAGMLLHLDLRPTGSGETALAGGGPWSRMSQTCLSPTFLSTFTRLESLTIPVQDVPVTLELVKRSADTLKSLCLLGKLLAEDEVRGVINVFNNANGGKLRKLSMCLKTLTHELVGLLVAGLPALWSLTLVFHKEFSYWSFTQGEEGQRPQYDWGLHDLSIYLGRIRSAVETNPVAGEAEDHIMNAMRKCIPSLRSYKQRSETVYPDVPYGW